MDYTFVELILLESSTLMYLKNKLVGSKTFLFHKTRSANKERLQEKTPKPFLHCGN